MVDDEYPAVFLSPLLQNLPAGVVSVPLRAHDINQQVNIRQPGKSKLLIAYLRAVHIDHIDPEHIAIPVVRVTINANFFYWQ